jgi:hypothetical protein
MTGARTGRTIAIGAVSLAIAVLGACSDPAPSTATGSSQSTCQPAPQPQAPTPAIDLSALPPLPPGSYATSLTSNPPSELYVVFVPWTIDAFQQYVVTAWPAAGVVLGKGDRETSEIDVAFTTTSMNGALKARTRSCDASTLDVWLGFTAR